ncbi:MAG: SDR family NAD(P)-dependent oxidoreductase [Clostridia bacterium]|nr:SDR family NAD(P)-dependent oxidoreductase [Clostridia bacterium]
MISNKTIVLTGASSGIGYEVLKLLSTEKSNLILAVSRHAEEKLASFADNVIPFTCDVSSREGVDSLFEEANKVFEGRKIDLFYANAGFPYYEEFNYTNWERILKIFETNTISPIYTYAKYLHHLDGREGHLAYTVSAIGQMAMPGYALYSATKFALHGFQQAIRLEMPNSLKLTCLYPVATDTNFFNVASPYKFEKPFPVQQPDVVARKMVAALEKGKKFCSPSPLFALSKVLMGVAPPVRTIYWKLEQEKLKRFKEEIKKYRDENK